MSVIRFSRRATPPGSRRRCARGGGRRPAHRALLAVGRGVRQTGSFSYHGFCFQGSSATAVYIQPGCRSSAGANSCGGNGGLRSCDAPRWSAAQRLAATTANIASSTHTDSLARSHSLKALAGAGRQTSDWGDSVSSHKRLKAEGSKSVMCQSSGSRGARVGKGVGQTGGRVPAALVSIQLRS